jgi:hypothetical protein
MNLRFVLQVVARTGWGCQGGLTGDGGFGDESAPSLVMELSTSSSEGGGRAGDGAGRSGRTPPPGRGVACTGEERADAAVATREGLRPASRNRRGRPPLPEYREEEKFAIVTQLSSWFRYFDNPNVAFTIVGHQTWATCYFDTIRTFHTSCTRICAV